MTIELSAHLGHGRNSIETDIDNREAAYDLARNDPERRTTLTAFGKSVLGVGGGWNTTHIADNGGFDGVDYHIADIVEPRVNVDPDRFYLINTDERKAELKAYIKRGVFRTAYGSTPAWDHLRFFTEYGELMKQGYFENLIVSKPAVGTPKDALIVDQILQEAIDAWQEALGDQFDPERGPKIFVHEHYLMKEPWIVFMKQFPTLIERFGRPVEITSIIEESKTDDDRAEALADGIYSDLMPHTASMILKLLSVVNETGKYSVSNYAQSPSRMQRFRHDGSKLGEGVETGFVVLTNATTIDHTDNDNKHSLLLRAGGGKGDGNQKYTSIRFESGDIVRIDFLENRLYVPDSARDLFAVTSGFKDNGYGPSMSRGFNGDPSEVFQAWEEAKLVVETQHRIGQLPSEQGLYTHPIGVSLEQLELATLR